MIKKRRLLLLWLIYFFYTNKNDIADKLEYGELEEPALNPKSDGRVMGPNSNYGVNENSPTDVFDRRGFKFTVNAKNPLVDEITEQADNQQLRKNFERTYMLDPEGKTDKEKCLKTSF